MTATLLFLLLTHCLPTPTGWVCFGPCADDSVCQTGCVCVGTDGGVGHCVSR